MKFEQWLEGLVCWCMKWFLRKGGLANGFCTALYKCKNKYSNNQKYADHLFTLHTVKVVIHTIPKYVRNIICHHIKFIVFYKTWSTCGWCIYITYLYIVWLFDNGEQDGSVLQSSGSLVGFGASGDGTDAQSQRVGLGDRLAHQLLIYIYIYIAYIYIYIPYIYI